MSILTKLFGKKESTVTYDDFWNWFQKNEKSFFKAVKSHKNIEKLFFDKLSSKLAELRDGYFFLSGMYDDDTAELILTADGTIKNIVFVEELVKAAPIIPGWKFTALKPASDIKNTCIQMSDYTFDSNTLSFYPNEHKDFPDQIDITIVFGDYNEQDKSTITNGIYIFLDNFIGELDSVTSIDNVVIIGKDKAQKDLIPIEKLKAFLSWRQKEFIEKYEGTLQNTDTAQFSVLNAKTKNGHALVAIVNVDILNWDLKASHPWLASIETTYDGSSNNGMPDDKTYKMLDEVENSVLGQLKDFDGYLNIGRQTGKNVRKIHFACKDFRKPSKVLDELIKDYPKLDIKYHIYKDKYWRSYDWLKPK